MKNGLKEETSWNIAVGIAALALLAGAYYALLMPKPSAADEVARKRAEIRKLDASIALAKKESEALSLANNQYLWTGDAQAIGARSLENVSRLARAAGLKVNAFRPQRIVESENVEQLPFLVLLDGSYPSVLRFLSSLESGASRLAVESTQVTSTDGSSDRVTASIVVVAVRKPNT